jgi:hypothetical protein
LICRVGLDCPSIEKKVSEKFAGKKKRRIFVRSNNETHTTMNKQQVTFEDFKATKSGMISMESNGKEATITQNECGRFSLSLKKNGYSTMMRYYDFNTAAELAVEFING